MTRTNESEVLTVNDLSSTPTTDPGIPLYVGASETKSTLLILNSLPFKKLLAQGPGDQIALTKLKISLEG